MLGIGGQEEKPVLFRTAVIQNKNDILRNYMQLLVL